MCRVPLLYLNKILDINFRFEGPTSEDRSSAMHCAAAMNGSFVGVPFARAVALRLALPVGSGNLDECAVALLDLRDKLHSWREAVLGHSTVVSPCQCRANSLGEASPDDTVI